jgi:hypothetical protein
MRSSSLAEEARTMSWFKIALIAVGAVAAVKLLLSILPFTKSFAAYL